MKPNLMQDDLPRVVRTLERAMEYHRAKADPSSFTGCQDECSKHFAYMEAIGIARHYIKEAESERAHTEYYESVESKERNPTPTDRKNSEEELDDYTKIQRMRLHNTQW